MFSQENIKISFFVEDDSDGFTYDEAATKCESMGGNILEPYNQIAITDSTHVLTDILSQTDKKFWIGIQFAENDFRKKQMWQFQSGIPIYEFQFPYWDENHGDPSGSCAMAKLNDAKDGQVWSKESCDTKNKGNILFLDNKSIKKSKYIL